MPCQTSLTITLDPEERRELESRLRSTTLRAGLVKRSRLVLLRADGWPVSQIADYVGLRRRHVEKWLKRFMVTRLDGLTDQPGRGRKPKFSPGNRGSRRQDCLRAA